MGFPYGSMKVPVPSTAAIACIFGVLLEFYKRVLAHFTISGPSGAVDQSVSAAEMVKRRLPVVRYRDEEDEEMVCTICLRCIRRGYLVRKLSNCSHVFHSCCLDQWVERLQVNCPNCRSLL